MAAYKFESIDEIKSLFLKISLPIIFFGVFYTMNSIEDNIFNVYVIILIPLLISFLFYWIIRNRVKIKYVTRIDENKIEIEKSEKVEVINFDQISSYKIQPKKFVVLNLKNKKANKIYTYSSFLNDFAVFENYCFDLENAIDDYNNKYKAEIKREILFFEKKWILSFLIFISLFCITTLSVLVSEYKKNELWIFIFPLLTLWAGYFDERNNKRLNT